MGYDVQLLGALAKAYGTSKQQNPVAQGLGGVGAATSGAEALGGLTGNTSLANLGGYAPYVGPVLGTAGLGLNLYNIANNPNLSTKQKIGAASVNAGEDLAALYGPQAPYVAAFIAAQAVGGQMERSGSPQIRAGGRQILAPLLPVQGFLDVLGGSKSPRASFNNMITQMGEVPVVGKPLGGMLRMFGLGTKPTEGHMFRSGMESLAGQIPALKGFDISKGNYAEFMPLDQYNSYSPQARADAEQIAKKMASLSPEAKGDNLMPYSGQLARALLGNYGNDITKKAPDILKMLGPQPAAQPAAGQGGAMATTTRTLAQQIQDAMKRSR